MEADHGNDTEPELDPVRDLLRPTTLLCGPDSCRVISREMAKAMEMAPYGEHINLEYRCGHNVPWFMIAVRPDNCPYCASGLPVDPVT